jgi:hypothetical protein
MRMAMTTPLTEPAPTDQLATYLAEVEAYLRRYVAWPSEHEPVAVALWVAHAHLVDGFETSPLLAVTSAEMRSGKTRVLEVLELLVPAPWRCVLPSEAVTYTVLNRRKPRATLLLDEADAVFGRHEAAKHEGLRAILNSGNRQGAPVLRVKLDGRRREVDAFDVFGPKAVAGIGRLPDTVTDRAIPVRMKRRAPGEAVERFRRRTATEQAKAVARPEFVALVALVADALEGAQLPEELNDRAQDAWEPLLAIADVAGGAWPARARTTAVALSTEDDTTVTIGIRLLQDVRAVFDYLGRDDLPTTTLLEQLHDIEDAPWKEWKAGRPLTARALGRLLERYGVHPQKWRDGTEVVRGYRRADYHDAWARYLPPTVDGNTDSATPPPSEAPQPEQPPQQPAPPVSLWGWHNCARCGQATADTELRVDAGTFVHQQDCLPEPLGLPA